MSYELSIVQRPGYLHAKVAGQNSAETVRGYLAEVRAACERLGCAAVLIEENLAGPGLSIADIFGVAETGARPAGTQALRIAYVDTNPEHSHPDMMFAETVATNRGVNVRVFKSVA